MKIRKNTFPSLKGWRLVAFYLLNYVIKHIKNVNRAQRFVFYENKDYLCGRFNNNHFIKPKEQ